MHLCAFLTTFLEYPYSAINVFVRKASNQTTTSLDIASLTQGHVWHIRDRGIKIFLNQVVEFDFRFACITKVIDAKRDAF